MKRRLLSALLALCMLTSLFPVALYSVAAVEEESQSSSAIFDYSSLYVGADGSTNENGGKLTLLLTSYLGDSSVSADKTIWNNIAPDATKHGTLYGTWSAMGKGGVGYDVANDSVLHCLRLDPSLLPVDTYSLEIVASVRGYTENADGVTPAAFYSNTSNLWLGRLNAFLFSGTRVSDDRSHNGLVVVMNDTASLRGIHNYQQIASGDAFYNALQIYRHNTGVVNLGIDLTKSETHYSYAFFHNGAEALPSKNITSCAIDTANTEEVHDYFDLLRNMGATTYSVRLYTKPLTEAERRQNHFADVCAFYALDMSAFDAQADNNLLYIQFAKISLDEANYTATKAAAQEKLDAYADAFWYNALYVGADGSTNENGGKLTLLLTSYLGDSSVSEDKATWNNIAPGATKHGTLTGTWSTKGQGGIGYDVADDSLLHQLELDASLLPVDTYSLELIASVRGYTENADGATPAAFYSNTSNMWLGRLNAFLFSGEKTNDIRNNNGLVVVMNDTASLRGNHNYQQIASGDAFYNTVQAYRYNTSVVNFGITLTKSATHYNYQFLHHGSVCQPIGLKFAKGTSSCEIDATNTETAHDRFYLFRNMGATAYSIRLYTKPLTEAERRQNHFVDVSAFYCLDLKGFDVKADNSFLYAQFASVSLDEDNYETAKAAAQLMLDTYKDAFLYSSLYVGADGSKTENGGKLTVLLTSFKSESSVTADKKAWINIAPGAVQNANLSGTWQERGFGGIGFDQAGHSGSGITFDGTLLPIDTYTIEMIAAVRGYTVNGDGVSAPSQYIYSDPGMVLGRLRGFLFSGALTGTEDAGSYPLRENSVIMMMYDDVRNHDTWGGGKLTQWTNSLSVYRNNPDIVNLSISLTKSLTHYNYQFLGNGKAYKLPKQNACEIATDLDQENYHGNFILFRDMSPTVHSVRLYDKTLTDAEGAHNHFIDLMAYAGADMTAFNAAGAETQAFIVTAMRNVKYTEDAAELEAAIQEIILSFSHEWDPEKALYVTEGLTVLLSSYKGFSTGVIGEENLMWSNAVQKGTAGMLMGNGWHKSEDGGLRIRDTIPQSVADSNLVREYRNSTGQNNFYLSFDYSLLPKEDYTIESVMAPEGITVKDESGKVTRYYDDYTPNGLYSDNAMVFGPLRAICFSCYSHAANANMARRWMYQAGYSWDSPPPGGRVELGQDKALDNLAVGQIVNYSILHDYALDEEEMPTSNYNILYEGARVFTKLIEADKYISKSEVTDKQFTLWRGLAGTVYAVRVYDRVLTEDELLQNRVADICYYFDLDTTLLEKALEQIDDKATVFRAFTGLSFDMTKEEAQAALDYGMAGLWISHEGVGVKSNMTDAIRYYFNLQYSALAMMMQSGFSVEVGILLNVGSEQKPVLEKGAYGYRYVVFDSVAGTHTEYFLDEDTCAITLSYPGASADAYNKKINIQTYVRLTSKDNETMCFYGGLGDFAYTKDNSLFAVYSYMAEQESVIESEYNEYLEQVVDSCYTEEIVYFDSAAEGKGNGTKETPYTDFADAFAACKSILIERKTPTHVTLFVEGGTHFIGDVAELDFDEISFKANTFTIEGDFLADEPPTLTTTVGISVSDFEEVEGKAGLYV
ncbi:MAG: hypothetical protein J6K61_04680, partial [Clostridia bacterium]|nr:hypothetical protein [Clostridia bacterium]